MGPYGPDYTPVYKVSEITLIKETKKCVILTSCIEIYLLRVFWKLNVLLALTCDLASGAIYNKIQLTITKDVNLARLRFITIFRDFSEIPQLLPFPVSNTTYVKCHNFPSIFSILSLKLSNFI